MDVNNFETFEPEEYQALLKEFGVSKFSDLVGKSVYYSKREYGEHVILKWDPERGEYLLQTVPHKFWSNPFRIKIL